MPTEMFAPGVTRLCCSCEKQNEVDLLCTVGIFPDKSEVGDVYHIVEAMKYDQLTRWLSFSM